jgi:hypothetical protein
MSEGLYFTSFIFLTVLAEEKFGKIKMGTTLFDMFIDILNRNMNQ